MHPLQNYNQRNADSRNGNKSKENRNNESSYVGTNKSTGANKSSSNEKSHDHSSTEKSDLQDKAHNKMPILNEKVFASKCTISAGETCSKTEQNDSNRAKDDSKESSNKTSKNTSTDNDHQQPPVQSCGEEASSTGNSSTKNTLNQTKSSSNYPPSIQHQSSSTANQITPPPPSNTISKFTGTQVPNRVFVGGISTDTTESELQSLFSQFGTIKATKIIIDRDGVPKGYGFITFTTEEEANKVLKESDNLILKNRKLNVAIAVKKQSSNPSLSSSTNLSRNFDLNQYNNMFYMPNGLSSIPAYMNEYPISFPEMYAYASPMPAIPNPSFAPYPLVYRPSSLYFPSTAVSMHHPSSSNHPQNATAVPHLSLNLQQQGQTNAQDTGHTSQYSAQQASIQQQQSHSNQQTNQAPNQSQPTHHSGRLGSNNSNPNSNHQMTGGAGQGNQGDGGYQSQYHLHHMAAGSSGQHNHMANTHHHAGHQHMHHSHQGHAQTNLVASNANQQHTPVFTGIGPYVHPLSLQYNHSLASIAANTTQQHQTSMTHQPHYTHNPLSSQHSQPGVNQGFMNSNWNPPQWR